MSPLLELVPVSECTIYDGGIGSVAGTPYARIQYQYTYIYMGWCQRAMHKTYAYTHRRQLLVHTLKNICNDATVVYDAAFIFQAVWLQNQMNWINSGVHVLTCAELIIKPVMNHLACVACACTSTSVFECFVPVCVCVCQSDFWTILLFIGTYLLTKSTERKSNLCRY